MKPRISILDEAFVYRPSYATAVAETWRRFGWRPSKRDEQISQQQPRALSQALRMRQSENATNAGVSP